MDNYLLYKRTSTDSKCSDCGKLTRNIAGEEWVIDYTQGSNYRPGVDTRKEIVCLNCGNSVKKAKDFEEQQEKKQTQHQLINSYLSEFKGLKSELNNKVKTTDLEISNLWRIWGFRDKINGLTNNELKEGIKELERLINEYASPKTKDDARKNINYSKEKLLKPIIDPCTHEKIVPCDNNPKFYACEYCWEQNSPEFLKLLEKQHENNIYNNWFKNYGLSALDINEFSLTKEFQIVRNGWYRNTIFFSQEQLWEAYNQLESKFNEFLSKKNFNNKIVIYNTSTHTHT